MKKVYIKTFGCQMNEHDTEIMLSRLKKTGYEATLKPEEADLVLINTCSVREKSYHKALSEIGRYKVNGNGQKVVLGVTGCVASQEGKKIRQQFPQVDLVIGTDHIKAIDQHVNQLSADRFVVASQFLEDEDSPFPLVGDFVSQSPIKASITIMKGCNHVCSYCIVPSVRGGEVSRDLQEIIQEVQMMVERGVKEVTLLGQNVNSYGRGLKPKIDFAALIQQLSEETDIQRIRFMSPHPTNLSESLIKQYQTNSKLCPHIHLPLQSGSTSVLKKMRRSYTRDVYLRKVSNLREACPDIAMTTDVIVGFPGETEKQFQETLSLIREANFDGGYTFAYSPRAGTEAATWEDDIPSFVKEKRLQTVLALFQEVCLHSYQSRVGGVEKVLIEGESKRGEGQLMGRTLHNRIVNFYSDPKNMGAIMKLKIIKAHANSLTGEDLNG